MRARPDPELEVLFDVPTRLSQRERFVAVWESANFMPASRREMTEALALLDYKDQDGGAARHLNEILLHQQRADTDDPSAAIRSVTQDYAKHYSNAQVAVQALTVLGETVAEVYNPHLALDTVIGPEHAEAAIQLVRFLDLESYLTGSQEELPEYPFKKDYTAAKPDLFLSAHIAERLDSITIGEARGLTVRATKDQAARQEFWEGRLVECKRHALARPIAERVLKAS